MNSSPLTRRDFLRSTTAAACATALLDRARPAAGAELKTRWPVACRDAHLQHTGLPDCWAAMKFLGLDGVEVQVTEELLCSSLYHPEQKYTLATDDGRKRVRDDFARAGVVITAFCMHNRLDERLAQEIEWTRRLVQAAVQLRVDVIRIDVVPRKTGPDDFLAFAIRACRQLCDTAADTPVRFGIENHGRVTNDPAFLEKLFDGVGSPKLGLTLDAMNFYWFGHPLNDVYGICEKFARRVVHTHCKNLRYPDDKKHTRRPMGWEYATHAAPLYEGDLDFQRVADILRQAGYRGDLCLENECLSHFPKTQHAEVLKKEIAFLKQLT